MGMVPASASAASGGAVTAWGRKVHTQCRLSYARRPDTCTLSYVRDPVTLPPVTLTFAWCAGLNLLSVPRRSRSSWSSG